MNKTRNSSKSVTVISFYGPMIWFCLILILESRFRPNRVSNSTKIASFERSPNSFVHWQGSDSRFRQKLVRRHSPSSFLLIALSFFIVIVPPPALSVLVAEDLRPVRHVHRQRSRSTDTADGGRGATVESRGAYGFAEFGRVSVCRVVEIGFVEFKGGIGEWISVYGREKTIGSSANVGGHEKIKNWANTIRNWFELPGSSPQYCVGFFQVLL